MRGGGGGEGAANKKEGRLFRFSFGGLEGFFAQVRSRLYVFDAFAIHSILFDR